MDVISIVAFFFDFDFVFKKNLVHTDENLGALHSRP